MKDYTDRDEVPPPYKHVEYFVSEKYEIAGETPSSGNNPSEVVEVLDADAKTEKRASWEAFEFALLGGGDVEVVNDSHENPDEHTYTVHVDGGIPANCTCHAREYQTGACKHMVAVASREPVLAAANEEPVVKADGGVTVGETSTVDSDERPDDCDCGEWNDGLELPCWPCYREGFETPQTAHTGEGAD